MQKLGFPSMKSLDQLKSLSGSARGTMKTFSLSPRPSSDSLSIGSFTNLKITEEKPVIEQASVKSDLEMANTKLKKSMEHIHALEEKLQHAFDEYAKFKVKQREDEKLWNGLESKFSSTKTLCDQLTETLQLLAGQVQAAEKDKEYFEEKLSANSVGLDSLNEQINSLSLKLDDAEETIIKCHKELEELISEREERENFYRDEQSRQSSLIEEKDAVIKKIEASLEAKHLAMERVNANLENANLELKLREDEFRSLLSSQEKLEKDKNDLQLSRDEVASKLASAIEEIKSLNGFTRLLSEQLVELDKQRLTFLQEFDQLNCLYNSSLKLVQEKMDLEIEQSQKRFDQLHGTLLRTGHEKDALQLVNQELNSDVVELMKVHESATEDLSEEKRMAGERIQTLEMEAEALVSKNIESGILVRKLEETFVSLSESAKSSENKMNEFLLKISTKEAENKDNTEKLQTEMSRKSETLEGLQKENEKHYQQEEMLEKQVSQLQTVLEEKHQLVLEFKDGQKKLEDKISENQELLAASENRLAELRKEYDVMLESKQMELSRHLRELSLRNDQAINDIRRKYEVEKQEIINQEKEKVDKIVGEMERNYEKKLAECKEEAKQNLSRVRGEHDALVAQIQQENSRKESSLKAKHSEELKRAELEAENELRERTKLLRNERDAQMKAMKYQYEDDCKKLEDELNLQKSREERQRALLQLQWKVMSGKPQEDQEVHLRRASEGEADGSGGAAGPSGGAAGGSSSGGAAGGSSSGGAAGGSSSGGAAGGSRAGGAPGIGEYYWISTVYQSPFGAPVVRSMQIHISTGNIRQWVDGEADDMMISQGDGCMFNGGIRLLLQGPKVPGGNMRLGLELPFIRFDLAESSKSHVRLKLNKENDPELETVDVFVDISFTDKGRSRYALEIRNNGEAPFLLKFGVRLYLVCSPIKLMANWKGSSNQFRRQEFVYDDLDFPETQQLTIKDRDSKVNLRMKIDGMDKKFKVRRTHEGTILQGIYEEKVNKFVMVDVGRFEEGYAVQKDTTVYANIRFQRGWEWDSD